MRGDGSILNIQLPLFMAVCLETPQIDVLREAQS